MTEEAEGLATEPVDAIENVDPQDNEIKDALPSQEDTARKGGWVPQDEFKGKPGNWRSAEAYNISGEWIDKLKAQQESTDEQIREIKNQFNTRLENTNKLHKTQLDLQEADLKRKLNDAIEQADLPTAKQIQADIDSINNQPDPVQPVNNDVAIIDNFNKTNPWIAGQDPKAAYGRQQFNTYLNQGMGAEQAITAMGNDINTHFPDVNQNRENHPTTEGGTKPGRKAATRKLGMSDVTAEELKYRLPGAFKDDKEFLQAVQDSRTAK